MTPPTSTRPQAETEKKRFGSPDDPRWTVDSVGGALPFVSPTAVAVGTTPAGAKGTSDVAQAAMEYTERAPNVAVPAFNAWPWEDDVAKVVIRLKFVQYLIRDQSVVMRGGMTVMDLHRRRLGGARRGRATGASTHRPRPCRTTTSTPCITRRSSPAYPTFRFLAHD